MVSYLKPFPRQNGLELGEAAGKAPLLCEPWGDAPMGCVRLNVLVVLCALGA